MVFNLSSILLNSAAGRGEETCPGSVWNHVQKPAISIEIGVKRQSRAREKIAAAWCMVHGVTGERASRQEDGAAAGHALRCVGICKLLVACCCTSAARLKTCMSALHILDKIHAKRPLSILSCQAKIWPLISFAPRAFLEY